MKASQIRPPSGGMVGINEHLCGYWSDCDKKWDSQRSRAELFKKSKIIKKYCLSSEIEHFQHQAFVVLKTTNTYCRIESIWSLQSRQNYPDVFFLSSIHIDLFKKSKIIKIGWKLREHGFFEVGGFRDFFIYISY